MGQAFLSVLAPENLLYLVGGVIIGLIMGAIPGLTATMAIALIIPFTYYLTPTQSLIMLLAAYNAGHPHRHPRYPCRRRHRGRRLCTGETGESGEGH